MSAARKMAIYAGAEAAVFERILRAEALCMAAMSFQGDAFDFEEIHALADKHYAYIMGSDEEPFPKHDKGGGSITIGGKR